MNPGLIRCPASRVLRGRVSVFTSSARGAHHVHEMRVYTKCARFTYTSSSEVWVRIKRRECAYSLSAKTAAFTSSARSVSVHIERTKCEYTLYAQMQVHSKSKHAKLHVHMTRTKCTQCTKGVRAYQAHEVCTYTTVARSVRERSKRTTCVCTSSASGVCTSGAQSS